VIHDIGCFAAFAQSFGFHATRVIIDQRLLRYSNPSEYIKKSQADLEEALRRLVDFQQHKLVPRFPPMHNQNGLLVCRDVFLYLMRLPVFQSVRTKKCCLKYRVRMRPCVNSAGFSLAD
jgi:hypothetical protein